MTATPPRPTPAPAPEHDGFRPLPSAAARWLVLAAGHFAVLLGLIGLLLPIVPTSPFLVIAAACYARASRRFYDRLLNNRLFGRQIREWRRHRSLPLRTKLLAAAAFTVASTVSLVVVVEPLWARVGMALTILLVAFMILRIPTRCDPSPARSASTSAEGPP